MKPAFTLSNSFRSVITFLVVLLLFPSCGESPSNDSKSDISTKTAAPGSDESGGSAPEPANDAPLPESMATLTQNEKVYAWVDRLNIRSSPNTSGKVIANVTEQEALEFTGEKSKEIEEIVLRGVVYDEPWLMVKTKDGKEGWVFGGAVKRSGETKGNDPISDNQFFYPHFGRFDLSTWKEVSTTDESGGDYTGTTKMYEKGGRLLQVVIGDTGEYGYSRRYKLMEANKKLLKERVFSVNADADFREATESVKVYTTNPPIEYKRSQKLELHHLRLNSLPMMVNGAWSESELDEVPSTPLSENEATTASIGTIDGSCKNLDADSGCSCDFKSGNEYVYHSDMDQNACVHLNGSNVSLKLVSSDYRAVLKKLSKSNPWITLQKKGPMLYFGKPFDEYGYENQYPEELELLIDVLLSMDKIPNEIPIQNNSEGMAIREVRDLANDAIRIAKDRKKKGETTISNWDHYANEAFDVYTRTTNKTNFGSGEADTYEGYLLIKSKSGKLLASQKIKGTCGC
ncbi:MAG: SH3 domain-containing protein [Bacteroidota bacterium]